MASMIATARSGIAALLLATVALFCASHVHSQTFNLENDRVQMAELHGLWRFHTGDDPDGKLGWADPGFDDSSWKLLRSDEPWSEQGYKNYAGMAWYRFQVILPPKHPSLALHIPTINTSYEVFANGRLIGGLGGIPPHEKVLYSGAGQVIPISNDLISEGGPLTIAIRVWLWPNLAFIGGGPLGVTRLGDASLLNERRSFQLNEDFRSASAQNVLLLGYLLAGFAGLGLFLLRPGEREYLWFAGTEVSSAALCGWAVYLPFHATWFQGYYALLGFISVVYLTCFPTFLVTLLKERRGWLYWIAIASGLTAGLSTIRGVLAGVSVPEWFASGILASIPYWVCLPLLLYFAARRGNLDARLLLGPVSLSFGARIAGNILLVMFSTGHLSGAALERFQHLFTSPFPISGQDIADFLMQISILAILVLRFARTRRDEERHASELEAARAVQQVLVPDNIPAIPGFQIESVYKPAGQVGGDFFQILPLAEGGVLVAIGDVSGKGMPAAMMVSLLVGRLQALADSSNRPAEILKGLNRRLHGRSRGGFTTCLILRADPDGNLTIANAGHIPPYRNGAEMAVESGLPLGLSEDATYSETNFRLNENEQLTLLTDGVVEARGKDGELFGFARTQAISREHAEQIAQTAQEFGQEDDITVLTLCHAGVPASV